MQTNSCIIYSIWPPLFLTICFSLPWNELHEAHRTSWGFKDHFRCKLVFRFSRESWEVSAGLALEDGPQRKVQRIRVRAPWGPSLPCWWTPGCGPESTVGSFLSHVRAPNLAGMSKVLPRSALGPMATVHLPKCPRVYRWLFHFTFEVTKKRGD